MPTRADLEAATPKCPRLIGPGTHSRGEWTARCSEPLQLLGGASWTCQVHGPVRFSEVVGPPLVASSSSR